MKVQLVLPKCDNPGARLIRGWPQPLGILSIATFLKQHNPDIEIEVLDGSVLTLQEIMECLDADIIGITAISRTYPNVVKVAEKAKQVGAKVVLGGQYATAMGRTILENRPYVDAVVRFDGEVAFHKYVNGVPLHKIENLIYRQPDGTYRENPIKILDVENLPIPDRSFLDLTLYDQNYAKHIGGPFKRAGTICSQRGCYWRSQSHKGCIFCAIPDQSWRIRNPEIIWREVEQLADMGFEFLYDVTDDIGADQEWLMELSRTKPPVKMHFLQYLSAKRATEETLEALLNMGTVQVFVGFESADPERLSQMQKDASEEDNLRTVEILRRYGMRLLASFVSGLPGETKESTQHTFEFARYVSQQPNTVGVHWDVLKPIPGSRAFWTLLEHPEFGPKYRGKDLFDMEEMRIDWIRTFCNVDYEYLCQVEKDAKKLIPDTATYSPLR